MKLVEKFFNFKCISVNDLFLNKYYVTFEKKDTIFNYLGFYNTNNKPKFIQNLKIFVWFSMIFQLNWIRNAKI